MPVVGGATEGVGAVGSRADEGDGSRGGSTGGGASSTRSASIACDTACSPMYASYSARRSPSVRVSCASVARTKMASILALYVPRRLRKKRSG